MIRALAVLLVSVVVSLMCTDPLNAANPGSQHKKLRILFNSDGGTPVFYYFSAPMSPKQLCRTLDELEGTQVDVFLPCPQFSDDQFWYPTKIGEIYDGRYIKDGKFEDEDFKRVANNVKSLLVRGIDPMKVWEERTHKLGLKFWPSLRMNDLHKDPQ